MFRFRSGFCACRLPRLDRFDTPSGSIEAVAALARRRTAGSGARRLRAEAWRYFLCQPPPVEGPAWVTVVTVDPSTTIQPGSGLKRCHCSTGAALAVKTELLYNGRRQASVKGPEAEIDFRPVVKLFNPCGAATWLLTEVELDNPDIAWGLCDLGMGFPEFGTVSLAELAQYRGRFGLGIERDLHFEADKPISAYIEEASRLGPINA